MNSLLIPLRPEPDPHAEVYCEKCGYELTVQEAEHCAECEMDFHRSCWWNPDYELCHDCLLKRYERLDRAMWHLKQDVFTAVQAELLRGKS